MIKPLEIDETILIGNEARDSTAIVAVTWDKAAGKTRLVCHRIFQPSPKEPLDFEATVESTVCELCQRFAVRRVYYDPYQMAAVAQRLQAGGTPMKEFPQTVGNLIAIGSKLYELIKAGALIVYPDDAIRLAISRAIAKETARGFQLTKEESSHKIDIVVALAMAAYAAVQHQGVDDETPIVTPFIASRPRGVPGSAFGGDDDLIRAYGDARSHGFSLRRPY